MIPLARQRRASTMRARYVVERNALAYRRMWPVFLAGFFEPMLFLFSIGIGVGELVGRVPGPGGMTVGYREFVAPAMLAVSAMNATLVDTTFSVFVKYKYLGSYDTMLATPLSVSDLTLGEISWGLLRGLFYSAAFLATMAVMGLVPSAWGLLALPGALLVAWAFGGAGLAATTWMRSFIDFDYVNIAIAPMFLLSATFFPLERYPHAIHWLVQITPLYQGAALERALVLGAVDLSTVFHAVFLFAMGAAGLLLGNRRLRPLLQP